MIWPLLDTDNCKVRAKAVRFWGENSKTPVSKGLQNSEFVMGECAKGLTTYRLLQIVNSMLPIVYALDNIV